MRAPFQPHVLQGISDPRSYTGNAAWYDISDVSSLRNNDGSVPTSGQSIKLVSDKSGNSAVNGLVLNGVASNSASAPDIAAYDLGVAFGFDVDVALADWTPSATQVLVSKWAATGNQRSWQFHVTTAGNLLCQISTDGTGATVISWTSTTAVGFSDFDRKWVRFFRNGATGRFFTSPDGVTWTQLGTNVTSSTGSPFAGTYRLEVGVLEATVNPTTGVIYRAKVYSDEGTTTVFDADFSLPAKLATSFTESSSNAATVTINTSGASGARISGARDLYQGTAANQPVLTIAATGNYLTFDGSNDYLKAASFTLAQPTTVYFVGSQVGWTSNDKIYDGNSGVERMALTQYTGGASPQIGMFAGSTAGPYTTLAVGVNAVVASVFNGASGSFRVNRGSPSTASTSTQSANGFTLGAAIDGSAPANITASEILIYSVAHATANQDAVALYAGRKWGISLT